MVPDDEMILQPPFTTRMLLQLLLDDDLILQMTLHVPLLDAEF